MNQDGIETELKWELSADGHAALTELLPGLLGPGEELRQENRFFDSVDGRLQAAGLSLRVRRENDRLVLTCKSRRGVPSPDGLHQHGEIECALDPGLWTRLDQPERLDLPLPPAWRTALAGAALAELGGFANRRLDFHDGPHLLCLDRTAFAWRTDCELEIETAQPAVALARWSGLLAGWGIAWSPQPLTKLHRFLRGPGPPPPLPRPPRTPAPS